MIITSNRVRWSAVNVKIARESDEVQNLTNFGKVNIRNDEGLHFVTPELLNR